MGARTTPSALSAAPTSSANTAATITTTWGAVSGSAITYKVYWIINGQSSGEQSMAVGSAQTYIITGAAAGTSYDITVTATENGDESPRSPALTLITWAVPLAPTGLSISSFTDVSASFEWTSVINVNYNVYYKVDSASEWSLFANVASLTNSIVNGLT